MRSIDTGNIKKIFEEDVFKGASPEDIDKRKGFDRAKIAKNIERLKKERGEVADVCPNCGSDLREVGVEQDETTYGMSNRFWNGHSWDWGKHKEWDSEVGDSRCVECEQRIFQGVDWDAE